MQDGKNMITIIYNQDGVPFDYQFKDIEIEKFHSSIADYLSDPEKVTPQYLKEIIEPDKLVDFLLYLIMSHLPTGEGVH